MSDHDTQPASVPVFSPAPYLESLHAYDALNASPRGANKAALLAVLSAAGITQVVVGFDGYGDSDPPLILPH